MKEKIKQKGFIQIPLLIVIIVSIVAVSTVITGVVLHKQGKLAPLIASVSQVFKGTEDIEPEIKSREPQPEKEQPLLEETKQEENSQTEQELEQAKLEIEKAQAEAEKAKQEAEKAKAEAERLKAEQEAQKLAEEQQKQEEQKQRELERKQTEEKERIANIEIVDKELAQLISELRQWINRFSKEKDDANDFIVTVRNTMNKYLTSPLIQQSGQQIINEINNLSFILEKLIDIENDRIEKLSSYLGSGIIPSANEFSYSKTQFENYFNQYERSDTKVRSLIETFVANEKIVLEEELQRRTKATQALEQLAVVTQEIDSQLATLDNQIKEKEAEIEREKNNPWLTQSQFERIMAKLISELNPLIDQWNSLVNTRKKIVTITYKLDDYANYGTPLSAEDKTFLWSLGISF